MFPNILDRVPAEDLPALQDDYQKHLDMFNKQSQVLGSRMELAALKIEVGAQYFHSLQEKLMGVQFKEQVYCKRHNRECPTDPRRDQFWGPHIHNMLWIDISGSDCQPFSSVNQMRPGWLSKATLPFLVWAYSTKRLGPSMMLHENVKFFQEGLLHQLLMDPHHRPPPGRALMQHLWSKLFCVSELGVPVARNRKYSTFSTFPFSSLIDDFDEAFQRVPACTSQIYLCASKEMVSRHVSSRAGSSKQTSEGFELDSEAVLPSAQWVRLQDYIAKMLESGQAQRIAIAKSPKRRFESSKHKSIVVDLSQTAGFWAYYPDRLPTILKNSVLWDVLAQREILPEEMLQAHGFPVPSMAPAHLAHFFQLAKC